MTDCAFLLDDFLSCIYNIVAYQIKVHKHEVPLCPIMYRLAYDVP